jgi:hypothetical protein
MAAIDMNAPFPTGPWTLYFHSLREKRWTLDTFQKIATASSSKEVVSVFNELGERIKGGMFFWMKDPLPPLWENYNNIRGGSYSVRGSQEAGIDIYKKYSLGTMLNMAAIDSQDSLVGISISPKILGMGQNQRIGFYVIKVWNKDAEAFNKNTGIHCLDKGITHKDILYTPHVEKKM